jgi:glutamyl-tRNA reductase
MTVLALGINHHGAPLGLRSRFAFAAPQLPAALRSLRECLQRASAEATLLSTCNRTELYVAADGAHAAAELAQPALAWLAEQGGLPGAGSAAAVRLADHAYVVEGGEAARHAFRVASGLDSMVLGEPQILGQIKLAVREAGLAGTLGSTLHQLFQRSFSVAKEVRSATDIGSHSVSMAAATVRLAAQLFEDLTQVKVLLVGAGEMIDLTAAHFASGRCSWSIWPCRATSNPRWRACATSTCTPSTTWRSGCRRPATSACRRWRGPRKSSTPA